MAYFNSLDANLQYQLGEEIITEIERYRALVEADLKHDKKSDLRETLNQFMEAIDPFKYLYGDYEFYTSLTDVAEGYYLLDEIALAQSLSAKIAKEYSERMKLFSQFSPENQLQLQDRIKNEWVSYNYFLQLVNSFDESPFFATLEQQYNVNVSLFSSALDSMELEN